MLSVGLTHSVSKGVQIRPVNLKTDLVPLADLIETAFADSMDRGGRAAIREMRTLSHLGSGLNIITGLNEMIQGIGLGYVWVEDGRLVGNVSIYPASWPREYGTGFIIANVAVHPDFRGHGIARQLMVASIEAIRSRTKERSAETSPTIVLQVEAQNEIARHLYLELGFHEERTFTQWRRHPNRRLPLPLENPPYITRRRASEWREEMALAERLRPNERGGIGWMRPLSKSLFRTSLLKQIGDMFNLRNHERLAVHDEEGHLQATLWIDTAFGVESTPLVLMTAPEYQGLYDEALLNYAVRRFASSAITMEHPTDDEFTTTLMQQYQFLPSRVLVHMKLTP